MIKLTDKNDLIYIIQDTNIPISSLFKSGLYKSSNIKKYPGLNQKIDFSDCIVKLEYKDIKFNIFLIQLKFNLLDKNITGVIFSYTHLKKILEKYNYINPVFHTKSKKELKSIKHPEEIKELQFINEEIIIQEKPDINNSNYKNIYMQMKNIYSKIDIFDDYIKIKSLSLNYNKYFLDDNIQIDQEKQIPIYNSSIRDKIFSEVFSLLKNNEKIYAICGPPGIGKSFTSLLIQKQLYKQNYNTIYINLSNNKDISELKEILFKEIFFLNLKEEEYILLISKMLYSNYNDIWDIINEIDEYCSKEKIDFLLILDQYQKEKDKNNNLFKLKVKKIFLISSINNEEIKQNLSAQNEGKLNSFLNYKNFRNLGFNKEIIPDNINKDNNIIQCIEKFDYLPITIFLLENKFNWNILDFFNSQFLLILKDLSKFFKIFKFDYILELICNDKINIKKSNSISYKSINKEEFLKNIKDIPLKYITYDDNFDKNFIKLYYAFEYVKYPLECEINNISALKTFKLNNESFLKGGEFENILKHKFILNKSLFKIDSFISVNEIINMKLDKEYIYINKNDLKNKSCIFISQSNPYGQDYDFAILYPQSKEIILIKAKYKITNSNIKNKSYYSNKKSINIIINALSQNLGIRIEKMYILYISSYEYNSQKTFDIINEKRINCLFYNLSEDYFTTNYKDHIFDIRPLPTYEIYPNSEIYTKQIYFKKRKIEDFIFSISKIEQKEKNENEFILNEYKEFKEFILKTQIKDNLKIHLGEFLTSFSNDYSLIPKIFFDYYILFFKITMNKKIDYEKKIILVYEENNKLIYYNIKSDKIIPNFSIINKNEYKNYYYVLGKWISDKIINLNENL